MSSSAAVLQKKNKNRCVAQFGRALRSGRRGRRFKSCRIDSWQGRRSIWRNSDVPVFLLKRKKLRSGRRGSTRSGGPWNWTDRSGSGDRRFKSCRIDSWQGRRSIWRNSDVPVFLLKRKKLRSGRRGSTRSGGPWNWTDRSGSGDRRFKSCRIDSWQGRRSI